MPLETLQRFWQHPVRAFFQMCLQVNFRTEDSEIPDTEPFILEGLSRYQINQQLLNALVEQDDVSNAMFRQASGRQAIYRMALLVKFSGKHSARRRVQALADRVIACHQPGQSMEIDLAVQRCADNWLVVAGAVPDATGCCAGVPLAMLSVSQGNATLAGTPCLPCQRVVMVKVAFFYAKTASGVFRRLQPNRLCMRTSHKLIEGYLLKGCPQPLLVGGGVT
ncbi:hypothetical protein MJ391_22935 [Escherichia coli]|nr:hypothetical protein MJ391_22935 [Escherichia coli]